MPPKSEIVQKWIELATHDLRTAEFILKGIDDPPYEVACYHAQQAAEKYLKAFLCFQGLKVPNTHDLVKLAQLISHADVLKSMMEDLAHLTPYAISARYPGVDIPETREDADFAIGVTHRLRECILPLLTQNQ